MKNEKLKLRNEKYKKKNHQIPIQKYIIQTNERTEKTRKEYLHSIDAKIKEIKIM